MRGRSNGNRPASKQLKLLQNRRTRPCSPLKLRDASTTTIRLGSNPRSKCCSSHPMKCWIESRGVGHSHSFLIISYKKKHTLQGINISHLGKRKIIFKMPFFGDMLVSWRVSGICLHSLIFYTARFLKRISMDIGFLLGACRPLHLCTLVTLPVKNHLTRVY